MKGQRGKKGTCAIRAKRGLIKVPAPAATLREFLGCLAETETEIIF